MYETNTFPGHGGLRTGAGRPAGRLTGRRRQVLSYILDRQARGEPVLVGPMVRACALVDRSSAYRIMKQLKDFGYLAIEQRT